MEKKELIESLEQLPERILIAEKGVIDANKEHQDTKEAVKNYEIAISNQVLNDSQKEDFKNSLSNAEKRTLEIKRRLSDSEAYSTYCKILDDKETRLQSLKLELDFLKRQFTARHTILRALGGE